MKKLIVVIMLLLLVGGVMACPAGTVKKEVKGSPVVCEIGDRLNPIAIETGFDYTVKGWKERRNLDSFAGGTLHWRGQVIYLSEPREDGARYIGQGMSQSSWEKGRKLDFDFIAGADVFNTITDSLTPPHGKFMHLEYRTGEDDKSKLVQTNLDPGFLIILKDSRCVSRGCSVSEDGSQVFVGTLDTPTTYGLVQSGDIPSGGRYAQFSIDGAEQDVLITDGSGTTSLTPLQFSEAKEVLKYMTEMTVKKNGNIDGKFHGFDVPIQRLGDALVIGGPPQTARTITPTGYTIKEGEGKLTEVFDPDGKRYYAKCTKEGDSSCFSPRTGEGPLYDRPDAFSRGVAISVREFSSYGVEGTGRIEIETDDGKKERETVTLGSAAKYDCYQNTECSGDGVQLVIDYEDDGKTVDEVRLYSADGFQEWKQDENGVREIQSRNIAFFSSIDIGFQTGCEPKVGCNGMSVFFSEDGSKAGNFWVDTNGDRIVQDNEIGMKSDKGALPPLDAGDKGSIGTLCKTDETCSSEFHATQTSIFFLRVLSGQTAPQRFVSGALDELGRWRGLTHLLGDGKSLLGFDDQVDAVDKWFAVHVLNEEYQVSQLCQGTYEDLQGEGLAIVQTLSGTYQPAANIQFERSDNPLPMFCQPEIEDDEETGEFICPDGLECSRGLCHAPGAKEPEVEYIYKVSWGVTAPQDKDFTPYINEDERGVSFNVCLKNKKGKYVECLYGEDDVYEGTFPVQLLNGHSDKGTTVRYHGDPDVKEACIRWKDAPVTYAPAKHDKNGLFYDGQADFFGGEGTEKAGEKLGDVCNTVVIISQGVVDFGHSKASITVSGGDVQENQQWDTS